MVTVVDVEIIECDELVDVYDIELDGEDCFIAEGVTVHNSNICIARTGAAWDINTGKPLPGSTRQEPFPGRPPWHMSCRSTLIAVVKEYKELLKDTEDRTRYHNRLLSMTQEQRQALDGSLPVSQNYADWLRKQPEAKQRQILGKGRLELWKNGKIGLSDLIDQSGRPLTIAELSK